MIELKLPTPQGNSKVALILGVLILIIVMLILMADMGDKDTQQDTIDDAEKEPWLNSDMKKKLGVIIIAAGVLYWYFTRTESPPTYYEIVKEVADKYYVDNGRYLSTIPENIRVRKGTIGEHYIEFINEIFTVVYVEGIGVQEVYPGQTIIEVKNLKDKDEIAMAIAKSPINIGTIKDRMRILGQLPEEEQ